MFNLKEGKWHPLTERLSRWARIRLLGVLIEKKSRKKVAEACGVTVQAISNWIHKENSYPSGENSDTLLRLVLDEAPRNAEEIIQNDIRRYFDELREIGIKVSQIGNDLIVQKN